mmetsp:Transcript_46923/g.114452  ORF Transcript_46923/g.114452 Transcript_46923/m.114452 type:complete len:89 (-) Transcript_46923:815-1081(-)
MLKLEYYSYNLIFFVGGPHLDVMDTETRRIVRKSLFYGDQLLGTKWKLLDGDHECDLIHWILLDASSWLAEISTTTITATTTDDCWGE